MPLARLGVRHPHRPVLDPKVTRTRAFPAAAVGGDELVKGPYVAETLPVEVEGRYVVVELP